MEQDRNFMGYGQMMQNNEYCPYQQSKYMKNMENMPPYMYGKCMHMNEDMQCGNYMMDVCPHVQHMHMNNCCRGDMYINPYQMQKMEPIETMCGKTYKVFMVHVKRTVQKIVMENMGMMPKSISKEHFHKHMNDMICEVMKQEDEIKKLVVVDRNENDLEESTDRAFCPFCNGMLKDTLTLLLVTELVRGGCTTCY